MGMCGGMSRRLNTPPSKSTMSAIRGRFKRTGCGTETLCLDALLVPPSHLYSHASCRLSGPRGPHWMRVCEHAPLGSAGLDIHADMLFDCTLQMPSTGIQLMKRCFVVCDWLRSHTGYADAERHRELQLLQVNALNMKEHS